MLSDTFSRQEWTPNKIEIHPCPTYRSTGQDNCRRPDRVIVAEHKTVTAKEIFSDYPKPSAKEVELVPATELLPDTNEKEKALGTALGDLTF
jgi:hypothetical protein